MSAPLHSRFFIVQVEPSTYEQFCGITKELLSGQKLEEAVVSTVAEEAWSKSQDIRDCIKIGTLAKSTKDVEFIVNKFFGPKTKQGEIQT
jgi:hypothetical protein